MYQALRRLARQSVLWLKIAVLIFAGLAPALITGDARAAQITARSATIGTSQSNVETTYKFDFTMPSATTVEGMIFEFCTAPLGTCTKPNAMDVFTDTAVTAQSFAQSGSFAVTTAANDCNIAGSTADTKVCVNRTQPTAESSGVNKSLTLGDILNPTLTSVYTTVYIRVSIYSDDDFQTADKVHEGTVAAGVTQQLTAVGRVAERLKFCVGAMEDIEAGVGETLPDDCDDSTDFPSNTLIDLGIIDNVSITTAPVDPSVSNANLSNDRYGILQVNTNASSGVVITYFPEPASSVTAGDTDQLRAFRVLPADCSASPTSSTDQCFFSETDATGIDQGTEEFGMAVACINANDGTRSTTDNFDPANGGVVGAAYIGDGTYNESTEGGIANNCENEAAPTGNTYVWGFETSTLPAILAHTTASSGKVVDDEIIKLRFGATASATTPTGTYTVVITYIATATF